MNKRGFLSMFNILLIFFLFMVAVSLVAVQNLSDENIKNFQLNMTWKEINLDHVTDPSIIVSLSYNFVNFIGNSAFQISNEVTTWVYKHPELHNINPKTILWFVIVILIIPILWYLFLIIASIILIIKEAIKNKREKRELKAIKEFKKDG